MLLVPGARDVGGGAYRSVCCCDVESAGGGDMIDERQVLVTLLDTESGERVTFPYEYGFHEYMWTEGNYGCDCNRHMFFWEAKGTGLEDIPCNTGPNRYKLTSVVDAETKEVLFEGEQ